MKKTLCAILLLSSLSESVHAEDLMTLLERQPDTVQPSPPDINPYNYILDFSLEGKEGKDSEPPFKAKILINPAAEGESRVTVISASSENYHDDFEEMVAEIRDPEKTTKELSEDFWCDLGNDNETPLQDRAELAEAFTVLRESETEAVLRPNLQKIADFMMEGEDELDMSKSERKIMDKMMKRMDGEFTISKPALHLKHFKIWLTKPMTVKIIAKIKKMELEQSCALAPNGFNYVETLSMNMEAKALGINAAQKTNIRVSALTLR